MKRTLILIIGLVFAGFVGNIVYTMVNTKSHSPEAIANYDKDHVKIVVKYCQPSKKGRVLFGNAGSEALEFYGEVWRTGANEATEISTSHDLRFGNHMLKAGNYSIYSIPGKNDWTLVFNSKTDYWGKSLFNAPFDAALDIFRITVPRLKNGENIERFTIDFAEEDNNKALRLLWGDIKVVVPFTVL